MTSSERRTVSMRVPRPATSGAVSNGGSRHHLTNLLWLYPTPCRRRDGAGTVRCGLRRLVPFGARDGPQAPGLADGEAAPLAGDDPGPPPRPHATVHALAADADVEAQVGLFD